MQAQNRILRKFICNNRNATLRDVQNDLKEGGFWMSITNICSRLNKIGYFHNPVPLKSPIVNSSDILRQRKKFAQWLVDKMDVQLYFAGYCEIDIIVFMLLY